MYGLTPTFVTKILTEYFGISKPSKLKKDIYLGLGLAFEGADQNLYDFNEVSTDVENKLNYKRVRVSFGQANNGIMTNQNTVIFPTANEDWTTSKRGIQSIGLFDTTSYFNTENKLVQPLILLALPEQIEIKKGETAIFDEATIVLSLTDN